MGVRSRQRINAESAPDRWRRPANCSRLDRRMALK
jgi:hypothetical protein